MRLLVVPACLAMCFILGSCFPEPTKAIPDEVMGMAPIYGTGNVDSIVMEEAQPIESLGKIYYKTPFMFATEKGRGIHIIDNSNPSQPEKIGFLRISGNSEIAIKGNLLYANNRLDLVTLDISNLNDVRIVSRLKDVFSSLEGAGLFPPDFEGFFECVDPNRGIVIGWEEKILFSPQCWR